MSTSEPQPTRNPFIFPIRRHLRGWIATAIGVGCAFVLIHYWLTGNPQEHAEAHGPAQLPELWGLGITPFIIILGSIAFLPLMPATLHWWEDNVNRLLISLF